MNNVAGSEEFIMQPEDLNTLIRRGRLLRNEMMCQSCLRFLRRLKSTLTSKH